MKNLMILMFALTLAFSVSCKKEHITEPEISKPIISNQPHVDSVKVSIKLIMKNYATFPEKRLYGGIGILDSSTYSNIWAIGLDSLSYSPLCVVFDEEFYIADSLFDGDRPRILFGIVQQYYDINTNLWAFSPDPSYSPFELIIRRNDTIIYHSTGTNYISYWNGFGLAWMPPGLEL